MKTHEIPRTEWAAFFDGFSRRHEGRLITLEVFGEEIGDQIEERELALEGATAEVSDAGDKIEIMIGIKSDDHITHTITRPNQVSLEQADDGADLVLAVKASDGTMTLLRLRSAMQPEVVDAVAI